MWLLENFELLPCLTNVAYSVSIVQLWSRAEINKQAHTLVLYSLWVKNARMIFMFLKHGEIKNKNNLAYEA